MKQRRRPSRHYRNIRTKKGKRRILINKNIPTIKPRQRKIFKHISDPEQHNTEFGGGLDFDKSGYLENFQVFQGGKYYVDLPADYEVLYHSHPDKNISPPTPEDVIELLKNNRQQAELVFRNGESFTVIKTKKTKKLAKKSRRVLMKLLRSIFFSTRGKDWELKYKRELEKLGFIVQLNKNIKSPIKLKIKAIELR
ncbi:MAG: hypothetical protein U9N86_02430 [Bacteroidota bacterium]|nr:hypothetical protein [Bacteroidota bacterium]